MTRALIAYYSRNGENYVDGLLRRLRHGNTELVAKKLQELTGAELFRIEPLNPYADDYCRCIDQARQDQRSNARPGIRAWPAQPEKYDRIYLGYPNYWGTMPMAVFTFLEGINLSGKIICPFCTHEGDGLGKSQADIQALCPDAIVKPGLAITGSRVSFEEDAIRAWFIEMEKANRP